MNREQEEKLKQLASELALDIKTGEDLSALSAKLVKLTVEAALSAELENHLGYPPDTVIGDHSGNSRNGTTPKILKGSHGQVVLETPRDRLGTFEPEIIKKGQIRMTTNPVFICQRAVNTRDCRSVSGNVWGGSFSRIGFAGHQCRSLNRSRNGRLIRWMKFIRLFIWIALF